MTDEQQRIINVLSDTVDGLESFQADPRVPFIEHQLGNVRYVRDILRGQWAGMGA